MVPTNPISLASVVYDKRPVLDAVASGEMTFAADRALFDRFVGRFPMPEKISCG